MDNAFAKSQVWIGILVFILGCFLAQANNAAPIYWIAILVGGLFICSKGFQGQTLRVSVLLVYIPLFSFFWILSLPQEGSIPKACAAFVFAATAELGAAIVLYGKDPKFRKAALYLVPLFALGMLVAQFSGAAGGPGRFVKFFTETLGWSMEAAETATYVVRKTLHFLFYGSLGVLASRAMRASGTPEKQACPYALAWPISHGAFDELRQYFTPERMGTPWDLLLDTAGAVCLVGLTYWISTRRARNYTQ